MFACGSSTTNVFRKKLNQFSLFSASSFDSFIGKSTSNFIEEFCGHFFATAVTVCGTKTLSSFIMMILPMASVVPNCLFATSSEITTEEGSLKQLCLLPLLNGKENTSKKTESTY